MALWAASRLLTSHALSSGPYICSRCSFSHEHLRLSQILCLHHMLQRETTPQLGLLGTTDQLKAIQRLGRLGYAHAEVREDRLHAVRSGLHEICKPVGVIQKARAFHCFSACLGELRDEALNRFVHVCWSSLGWRDAVSRDPHWH